MTHLELDVPKAVHGTDGGSGWPGVTEMLHHVWVLEDTFHNDKGSDKMLEGMTKAQRTAFQDKKQGMHSTMQ